MSTQFGRYVVSAGQIACTEMPNLDYCSFRWWWCSSNYSMVVLVFGVMISIISENWLGQNKILHVYLIRTKFSHLKCHLHRQYFNMTSNLFIFTVLLWKKFYGDLINFLKIEMSWPQNNYTIVSILFPDRPNCSLFYAFFLVLFIFGCVFVCKLYCLSLRTINSSTNFMMDLEHRCFHSKSFQYTGAYWWFVFIIYIQCVIRILRVYIY